MNVKTRFFRGLIPLLLFVATTAFGQTVVPPRAYGTTTIDVRDHGAVGDGVHDDTSAFEASFAALAAESPDDGGTVNVPAGRYLIDPGRSIKPRSHTRLYAPQAVLVTKPNALSRYYVVLVEGQTDVDITVGQIVGDRLLHTYGPGTNEWGMGIGIKKSSRVTVRDTRVEQMTGDGASISGNDIVLSNVLFTQNRRQGLTIAVGSNYQVLDSKFTLTGALGTNAGTAPQAGIDIEPDAGLVDGVLLKGLTVTGNGTAGILMWTRTGTGASVQNVTIDDCDISGNANGIQGHAFANSITATITNNRIGPHRGSGIRAESGFKATVQGNVFTKYGTARKAFDLTGTDSRTKYDINALTGSKLSVLLNHYK